MADKKVFLSSLKTNNTMIKEFISEFVGTLILVLMCNCSIAVQVLGHRKHLDLNSVGIATGTGLMIAAYTGAKVSGGHVNPVVTLAVASVGKFPWRKIPHYFVAQYLGGFVASIIGIQSLMPTIFLCQFFSAFVNYYPAIDEFDGGVRSAFFNATSTAGILTTHPSHELTIFGALFDQIVSVGLLQFGIMCIIDEKNLNVPKPLIPISLAFLLAALIMAFGLNCGPALNPARDIPGRIFANMVGYGSDVWKPQDYVYWLMGGLLGPHIGGIIGAYAYYVLIEIQLEDDRSTKAQNQDILLEKVSDE